MHKSSSLTFFYKYLFTPIWAGFILFGIASVGSHAEQFFKDWNLAACLIVLYGLIWLITALVHLEQVAKDAGLKNLVGVITGDNKSSMALFEKAGFEKCAHFKSVGEKFGKVLDVVAYQKEIG